MSWNHRRHCATYLRTYIFPYFDNTALADLRALEIEGFQSWLLKQPCRGNEEQTLSPTTCNHVAQACRLITRWAIRQRVLTHDPFVGVESLAMQPKRRGIFTMEEVKRIFAADWPDPGARVLNMLAAACGFTSTFWRRSFAEVSGIERIKPGTYYFHW
ncbi:MAG: hypothetical protein GH155_04330 [Spirochaeta sp.]|nr:hypothetical protein [Spirochaeta sp.]